MNQPEQDESGTFFINRKEKWEVLKCIFFTDSTPTASIIPEPLWEEVRWWRECKSTASLLRPPVVDPALKLPPPDSKAVEMKSIRLPMSLIYSRRPSLWRPVHWATRPNFGAMEKLGVGFVRLGQAVPASAHSVKAHAPQNQINSFNWRGAWPPGVILQNSPRLA